MVFEDTLKDIFDEEFIKRAVKLKKTGNVFSPIFYIIFTRLVEISALINDIVLPNRIEIEEMFRTRKEFLQLDMETINETLRRVWIFEIKRDEEYKFSKSIEDLMYIVHRMRDIQKRIDKAILDNIRSWSKDDILDLYFILCKFLLEIEEEIVDISSKEMKLCWLKSFLKEINIEPEIVDRAYEYLKAKNNPFAALKLAEINEFDEIKELKDIFKDLDDKSRKIVISGLKLIFENSD